jgi:superfamily II DNA or RNA helicase
MRLVCSPRLREADIEAIRRGYELRKEPLVESIRQEVATAALESIEAVELLAWMVGRGTLDIRIAVPSNVQGLYHEKFGIFSANMTDFAAFTGSPNETEHGVLWNFEQIAVFVATSDEQRESQRISSLRADFDGLWGDRTAGLEVIPFPEAARRELLQHQPTSPPRPRSSEVVLRADLYPHQIEAVATWQAAGYRGILEMATGTGKTITALEAVLPLARHRELVIVVVPGIDLLHQWEQVIRNRISGAAIVSCGGGAEWVRRLSAFLQRWRLQASRPDIDGRFGAHFVIATMDTAASERFQARFLNTGSRSVLVIDEVHRVGSRYRRQVLDLPAERRLGLSATPERPWDAEGARAIDDGVGPVVFRFPLEDAVGRYLTPYEYHPRLVSLTPDEREDYADLSKKILEQFLALAAAYPQAHGDLRALLELADPSQAQSLELLLYKRADVLKEAVGKLELVAELARMPTISSCLVYCNDEGQVEETVRVLRSASRSFGVFTTARLATPARKVVLRDFEEGVFDFLVAIRCLDEGIDIPGASHALILASSRTEREFIQRRGRILRKAPGKTHSVIHDPVVIPFTLDQDDRPTSTLDTAELGIIARELHRVEIFARAASNDVDAMAFMFKVRKLVREAAGGLIPTIESG